jgi:hypothetical protein
MGVGGAVQGGYLQGSDPRSGRRYGTIVRVARQFGYEATGADLKDRGHGFSVQDYLKDCMYHRTLVFNAPYSKNEAFLKHARLMADEIAALVRLPFLAGQERWRSLYAIQPPGRVLILSERPSCPPGDTDVPANGGTTDYCWLYFNRDHSGPSTIEWLPPRAASPAQKAAA